MGIDVCSVRARVFQIANISSQMTSHGFETELSNILVLTSLVHKKLAIRLD